MIHLELLTAGGGSSLRVTLLPVGYPCWFIVTLVCVVQSPTPVHLSTRHLGPILLCCDSLQPHQWSPWAGTQELGWGGEVGKGTGRVSCLKGIISFSTAVTLCAFCPILKMWKPRLRGCVRQFGPGPPPMACFLYTNISPVTPTTWEELSL